MSKIDEILKQHHSGEEIEKFENIKREYRYNPVYEDRRVLCHVWKVVMLPLALFAISLILLCYQYTIEYDGQIPMDLFGTWMSAPYLIWFSYTVLACMIWWPPKDKRKLFVEGVYAIYTDKFTLSVIFSMVAIQIISAMWIVFMK